MKIKKIGGGGSGRGSVCGGGQGGCERRIEVFVKIPKNRGGGSGWGSGWWGGGLRVDVNAMLGVADDVGNGGCEPRTKKNHFDFFKGP